MKPRQAPEAEGRVGAPETAVKPRLFAVKDGGETPLYLATSREALARAIGAKNDDVAVDTIDPATIEDELIAAAVEMAQEDRLGRDADLVWPNYDYDRKAA